MWEIPRRNRNMIIKAINDYVKEGNAYKVCGDKPIIGKMTGTMLGGITGMSPYSTPFSVATELLRIYEDEEVGNFPSVIAGKYLEPVILNYLDKSGRLENTQAEVLFPRYEQGSHMDWKSHFDDEYFSGHIDAIAGHVKDAHDGFGIVENKTTTNESAWDWVNSIPPTYYWLQASLYAYFFGYDTIYFTVGILTLEERDDPTTFVPNEDNVRIMKVGLYPDFPAILDRCREWYDTYIKNGRTPDADMNNGIDRTISILLDSVKLTEDEILPIFHRYVELNDQYNKLGKEVEELRTQLTTYFDNHNIEGIGNADCYYEYSTATRKGVDTKRMKADGIYQGYLKETTYKVFKKAKHGFIDLQR